MYGMRQRWWKAASFAVLGGTLAAGSWYGFASAQPLPGSQPKSPSVKAEPVVPWVRATSASRFDPPAEPVVPASSKLPAVPIPSLPETVIPAGAKIQVPIVTIPTLPVDGEPPTTLPTTPAVPEFKPVPVPAVPGSIDPIPMPGATLPTPAPVIPMPTTTVPTPVPTTPMVPRVDEPLKPVITPPTNVAPPAPPLNSADPAKPMLPLQTDLNLRPTNTGNSVKPDVPMTPVVPPPMLNVVPPPMLNAVSPPMPLPVTTTTIEPATAQPTSRTKPGETLTVPTEKYVFPLPTSIQIPAPGVSTMMSNPTVMAALTGIALAFGPDASVRADDPTKPVDVVQLKKDLDEANRKLGLAQRDIDQLSALLYGRKGVDGKLLEYDLGALEEIRRLKEKVKALESNTTSMRPNVVAVTGKGTVKVVNEYPIPVSIIINEKNYRVEPNTALNVDVPVGDFSYQLLQSGAAATRSTIKEKETVTLRVK